MDAISQFCIIIFGCSAIWVVGRKERWSRWGYILGLCSEPFWLYTSYTHDQWGIFLLGLWYAYAWGQGVYFHWYIVGKRRHRDKKSSAAIKTSTIVRHQRFRRSGTLWEEN